MSATIYIFNNAGVPVTLDKQTATESFLTFPPEYGVVPGFSIGFTGEKLKIFVENYINFRIPQWWR